MTGLVMSNDDGCRYCDGSYQINYDSHDMCRDCKDSYEDHLEDKADRERKE